MTLIDITNRAYDIYTRGSENGWKNGDKLETLARSQKFLIRALRWLRAGQQAEA